MEYNFKESVKNWQRIPIDNVGYFDTVELLSKSKSDMNDLIDKFESNRYSTTGYRNWKNRWRDNLGLDTTSNKIILDYGCGFGLESLQFVKNNNEVIIADINENNLKVAEYVLNCKGYKPKDIVLIQNENPFFTTVNFDIFYSNGVLHHTPKIKEILKEVSEKINDGGECRLMLYSDISWRDETGYEAEINIETSQHPKFSHYCYRMDPDVSNYADWYSEEKIKLITKDFFNLKKYNYICGGQKRINHFCTVILKNKTVGENSEITK